jgi:signal transduction histidine kinase/HD-like signal output (HDOD) protein
MPERLPQQILESVSSVPLLPLPQVLVRFLALAEDDRRSMKDLVTVVAMDPAFAAQLITIATSPPFSRNTTPFSLEKSMASLGLPLLRALAGCLAVQNLQLHPFYERNLDYPGFWSHSLRVAACAKSLAEAAGYHDPEEAYFSGLLHDIGQLLLVGGVAEFCDTLPAASGQERGLSGLTQILNGVDLANLGARLVDNWQISSFMSDAVLFHKFPADQIRSADLLCRVVWSAHYLSGTAGEIMPPVDLLPDGPQIPALLGIEQTAVDRARVSSLAWAAGRAASLGLQMQMTQTVPPDRKYIFPYLSLPKKDNGDAAQLHLEARIRIQAVMQPLQQSLAFMAGDEELIVSLSTASSLLFGLRRPVFLLPLADRPALAAAAGAGHPPLLARLEIPLEPCLSLAAAAFLTQRPCSSFAENDDSAPSLLDIQLARLLGSDGLLCIPMSTASQPAGVMVFGLTGEQYACKLKLLEWMTVFAQSAAGSFASLQALRQRDHLISADLTGRFEQKARKVIHEAVNPLGIINNYLQIFAGKLGDGADGQQELTILKEEIFRVERIIRGLNDQPEQPLPVESVNVNTLIEGMLVLYGESLFEARKIEIGTRLASGLPPVRADRDSLKQILLNLWKNSVEAMPSGGSLLVSTEVTGQESWVEIRLSDSGPGIPADVRERLFQPLAPDRRPAHSGVGLSIVASLVERLGGEITCDSTPQGTTFAIRIALAQ